MPFTPPLPTTTITPAQLIVSLAFLLLFLFVFTLAATYIIVYMCLHVKLYFCSYLYCFTAVAFRLLLLAALLVLLHGLIGVTCLALPISFAIEFVESFIHLQVFRSETSRLTDWGGGYCCWILVQLVQLLVFVVFVVLVVLVPLLFTSRFLIERIWCLRICNENSFLCFVANLLTF